MVALLSGELDVTQRATILKRFRDGKERVLVTTNVCARGIDVEQVTLVVNFDLPMTKVSSKTIVYSDYSIVYRQGYSNFFQQQEPDFETYIHRIGRTGRFGKSGIAINFVSSTRDQSIINRIASHFKTSILALDAGDYDDLENKLKK